MRPAPPGRRGRYGSCQHALTPYPDLVRAGDRYERNRVLGFPVGTNPQARQAREPQRVMGIPVDDVGLVDLDWLRSWAHPIRMYQRWVRRRRLGPYETDDDPRAHPG
jgi:hypothetical protein